MSVSLAHPLVLSLLLFPGVALLSSLLGARRARRDIRALTRRPGRGPGALGAVVLAVAAAAAVVAAAGPRWGVQSTRSPRQGVDVVVVLDVSRSMAARDVTPSRLDAAKEAIVASVRRLDGDRVGVVVFGGDARLRFPLTADLEAASEVIRGLEPAPVIVGAGSSASSGLAVALDAFDDEHDAGRLVVVVTDGNDLGDDPAAVARAVAEGNVEILVAGVGTPAGAPVPVYDGATEAFVDKLDEQGNVIVSRLDEPFLRALAAAAGGTYVGSSLSALPGAVVGRTSAMERAQFESRAIEFPVERFQWFAGAALAVVGGLALLDWLGRPAGRRLLALVSGVLPLVAVSCATDSYSLNEEGRAAQARGDLETAVERFYAAEAAGPGDAEVVLNLSGALVRAGRYEEASRAARRVIGFGTERDRARAFSLLGHARFAGDDYAGALEAFRQVLLLEPANGDARHDYEVVWRLLRAGTGDPGAGNGGAPGSDPTPAGGGTPGPGDPGATPGGDPDGGDGTPGGQPGGGQPGGGQPGSPEEVEELLGRIDDQVEALLGDGTPTAEEAARILDLLAERARIASLRGAFDARSDPGDY